MDKIKVLWINSDDEKLEHYIEMGMGSGIEITKSQCKDDFCNKVNAGEKWDAIVLNAEVKTSPNIKASVDHLGTTLKLVRSNCKDLPCYIVTADEALDNSGGFKRRIVNSALETGNEEFRIIRADKDAFEFFKDIKLKVDSNPITIIKRKYSNVCNFCNLTELVDLLMIVEKFKILSSKEQAAVPNSIRTILEWLKTDSPLFMGKKLSPFMKERLKHPTIEGKNGSIRSCEYYSELQLNKFSKAFETSQVGVPIYVHRSFFACVSSCQPGSHYKNLDGTNESVRQDIKSGQAPYLIFTLIFELLTILGWCASLDEKTFEL